MLRRNCYVRVIRNKGSSKNVNDSDYDDDEKANSSKKDDSPIGVLRSLRRMKEVVKEVGSNTECGVDINGISDVRAGDVLECFDVTYEPRKLGDAPPKASILTRLNLSTS